MFQYQVDQMRKNIRKLVEGSRPPASVGIKRDHAIFLKLKYKGSTPINEKRKSGIIRPNSAVYGSIVMVSLYELYLALKGAKGVDNEGYEYEQETGDRDREAQNPNEDHGQADQESEGTDWN